MTVSELFDAISCRRFGFAAMVTVLFDSVPDETFQEAAMQGLPLWRQGRRC
jgi:hypothetical protein